MFITNAVISKGYNGAPALNFTQNGESKFVRFRIGSSVYDKNAENKRRYVNLSAKAFNGTAARIESMKLDAGKYVNIVGRYDEETWDDQTTHEKKSAPVLIVDEIEFCSGGNGGNGSGGNGQQNGEGHSASSPVGKGDTPAAPNGQPGNFTGYEGFGGPNPYFPG